MERVVFLFILFCINFSFDFSTKLFSQGNIDYPVFYSDLEGYCWNVLAQFFLSFIGLYRVTHFS